MQDLCEACMFSDYYEEYTCAALWEEDVAARYLEGQYRQCPYFRPGDDYTVVRHQN